MAACAVSRRSRCERQRPEACVDRVGVQGPPPARTAAEDLQAADLAAELAVQPEAPHRLVEVADGQRADVRPHRAGAIRGPAIERDGRRRGVVRGLAEIPAHVLIRLRRVVGHGEGGPLADLEPAGRAVVLDGVGPLVHRQPQPAVRVADEVDAVVVAVQAEDDPVPAAADLEALRLQPAEDRERAQAAQVVQRPVAGLHPAPGRAVGEVERAAVGPPRGALQRQRRRLALGDAGTHDRVVGLPVHGDLHERPGAAALGVRHGQGHGVEPGLLEDVDGVGLVAGRAVAEIPARSCRRRSCRIAPRGAPRPR